GRRPIPPPWRMWASSPIAREWTSCKAAMGSSTSGRWRRPTRPSRAGPGPRVEARPTANRAPGRLRTRIAADMRFARGIGIAVVTAALATGSGVGHADGPPKQSADPPDEGLLEFLGNADPSTDS